MFVKGISMKASQGKTSRRTVIGGSLGAAVSLALLDKGPTAAQSATPVAGMPAQGYAAVRIHTLSAADLVPEIDTLVVSEFVPIVQRLPGYKGYILGDSVDNPRVNFSVSWFANTGSATASTQASAAWVKTLDPKFQHESPIALDGPVLIAAGPTASGTPAVASPAATPQAGEGYVTIRRYRNKSGADTATIASVTQSGFVPIISSVAGFRGYLWLPLSGGRVSISLFDTKAQSDEATTKAASFVAQNTAQFTEGKPDIYSGKVVFADVMNFGLSLH